MTIPPRRIGLVQSPHRPEAAALTSVAASAARAAGASVWEAPSWDDPSVADRLPETDIVLCFGGDGTLIRGARATAAFGVPIVGVNLGRVGFLAEFSPDEMPSGWDAVLRGEFWIEERVTLHVEHRRNGEHVGTHLAVNDAIIGRGRTNRIVRLHTWIDGQYLTSFAADGLLVATPTGSTGSNLAAGGPILPPDMPALVMVPILPFVSFRNPLIFGTTSQIDVQVVLGPPVSEQEAVLSIDGGYAEPVEDGDRVSFRGNDLPSRFARVRPRNYFHASLVPKLQRGTLLTPLSPDTPSPGGTR